MKCQIHCPFCEETYELDEFPEGAQTMCEKCGQEFTIDMTVLGPGKKAAEPVGASSPKSAGIVPPPPPQQVESSASLKTAKTANASFKTPIIADVFRLFAYVTFFVAGLAMIPAIAYWNKEGFEPFPLFLIFSAVFSGIVMLGFGELASHIGEIRFHAIRQTELLEIIAGENRKNERA